MTMLSLWNDRPFFKHVLNQEVESVFSQNLFLPPCDIEEKKDCFLITLDLPGVKTEEIEIEAQEDTLTISGERKTEQLKSNQERIRSERFSGKFQRVFALGEPINPKLIEASYEAGVLRVRIPREKEVKPESVKIKVGEKLNFSDAH